MKRTLNFTNRRDLPKKLFRVACNESEPHVIVVTWEDDLDIPHATAIVARGIDPRVGSVRERMELTTCVRVALDNLMSVERTSIDLRWVDASGLVLAEVSGLTPMKPDETPSDSLIAVRFVSDLGLPWNIVEPSDDASDWELHVDERFRTSVHHPLFRATVLPELVRRVAEKAADGEARESAWFAHWDSYFRGIHDENWLSDLQEDESGTAILDLVRRFVRHSRVMESVADDYSKEMTE